MSKKEKLETRIKQIESEIANLEREEYRKGMEKKLKQTQERLKHPYRSKFKAFLRGETKKLETRAWKEVKKFRAKRKGKRRKLF